MEKYKLTPLGKIDTEKHPKWSVFKNLSPELREFVLAKDTNTKFNAGFEGDWEVVSFEPDENGEIACKRGKNVRYFPKEDVYEYLGYARKDWLAKNFDPTDNFFKLHGPLWKLEVHKDTQQHVTTLTVLTGGTTEESGNNMSYVEEYQFVAWDSWAQLGLKFERHYTSCFMEYDENGNFLVRDYNMDLDGFQQGPIKSKQVFEAFQKYTKNLKGYEKRDRSDYMFSEENMLSPCFYVKGDTMTFVVEKIKVRYDKKSYQKHQGCTIYKKPTKLLPISAKEILELFESKFLSELKPKFFGNDTLEFKPLVFKINASV